MGIENTINSSYSLFLKSIKEGMGNTLSILISPALLSPKRESIPGTPIVDARRILVDDSCVVELIWHKYVSYAVRNESYAKHDNYEILEGKYFCTYSESPFLDYIKSATFATDQYPGPLKHWGIYCENHIIDIVSDKEPSIVKLEQE